MGAAEEAYAEAERRIAEAKAEGAGSLDLKLAELTELPPKIGALSELRGLDLWGSKVTELAPLAAMRGLKELNLSRTLVSDLTPLRTLTALKELWVARTQVQNLGPLADLPSLAKFSMGECKARDLSPLSYVPLELLFIDDSEVEDLSPLAGSEALQMLWLQGSQVRDLRPLRRLHRLASEPRNLGLRFEDTPATEADPRLAEIAEIALPSERARALFDYLDSTSSAPKQPDPDPLLPAADPAEKAPSLPIRVVAPIQVDTTDEGFTRHRTGPDLEADMAARAQAGWEALKRYKQALCEGYAFHNYPQLQLFLDAFDEAMGDSFDPENAILIATMGGAIVHLSDDAKFTEMLPTGAAPLLQGFAAQITLQVDRFDQWTAYRDDAARGQIESDRIIAEAETFDAIEQGLQESGKASPDVLEPYDVLRRTALEGKDPGAAEGLLASTVDLARSAAERGMEEVKSGKPIRDAIKNMDGVHDAEFAKVKWYLGGFAVVFLKRNQKPFRNLADKFGLDWLNRALDYLFKDDDPT